MEVLGLSEDTLTDDLPGAKEIPAILTSYESLGIREVLTLIEAHDSSMNRLGAPLLQGARATQMLRPVKLEAIEVACLPVYPVSRRTPHLDPVFNHLEICVTEATLGMVVDSRRYTGLDILILKVLQCFNSSVVAVGNNHLGFLANGEKGIRAQVMDLRHIVIGSL